MVIIFHRPNSLIGAVRNFLERLNSGRHPWELPRKYAPVEALHFSFKYNLKPMGVRGLIRLNKG
jgi:hypothetical protein